MVDGLAGSAAGGSSSSDALTCDGGQCASTCVICLEQPEAEVGVLPCGHCAGCGPCVRQWVTQSEACPTCRRSCKIHEVSFVDLKKGAEPREEGAAAAAGPSAAKRRAARVEAEVVEVNAAEGLAWGSKPAAIVAHLRTVLAEGEDSRAIVFTAFDQCLSLLHQTLLEASIHAVRFEGTAEQRHEAIAAFSGTGPLPTPAGGRNANRFTGRPRVLLLSSKHSASGTNLQCANHVLFVEPPGTNARDSLMQETQAIGRTLRLNQTRQVKVRYFLMCDSIEEDIYEALTAAREREEATNQGRRGGGGGVMSAGAAAVGAAAAAAATQPQPQPARSRNRRRRRRRSDPHLLVVARRGAERALIPREAIATKMLELAFVSIRVRSRSLLRLPNSTKQKSIHQLCAAVDSSQQHVKSGVGPLV